MPRRFPEALAATARGLSKRMSEAGRGWPAFEAVFYEGLGRIGTAQGRRRY